MNRYFPAVLLALLVMVSGCSALAEPAGTPTPFDTASPTHSPTSTPASVTPGSPTPTPEPDLRTVAVTVTGSSNSSHTSVLWFVDAPVTHVVVQYANGTERTVGIQNATLPDGTLVDAVSLSPAVAVEREVSHTDDSPRNGATLRIPTAASDLFLVVFTEGNVVGWQYYTCGPGDVADISVTVTDQGLRTEALGCDL